MNFWPYVLKCSDGTYYTGHTQDLDQCIAQHQAGAFPGYTHDRRPLELMFAEWFQTRFEALERERQVGNWSRAKKEASFRSDWNALADAARSRPRVSTSLDAGSNRTGKEGGTELSTVRFEFVENPLQPAIILVRPQLGENIGKAARAMLNFGLTDLRLVQPRDGWPNPSAGPAASGADIVLERAQVYDSVAAATADCAHVYATTVRKRGVTKPVVTPAEAAQAVHTEAGRSAFLFGPERSGLETDDVALARTILTVPINPAFGSLNLAQAVILVAYEWSKGQALAQPPETQLDPPAPQGELDGMIGQLDAMLETTGYYFPPDRTHVTKRTIRTMLTKPGWSSQELRTFRGVLSALAGKKRPRT